MSVCRRARRAQELEGARRSSPIRTVPVEVVERLKLPSRKPVLKRKSVEAFVREEARDHRELAVAECKATADCLKILTDLMIEAQQRRLDAFKTLATNGTSIEDILQLQATETDCEKDALRYLGQLVECSRVNNLAHFERAAKAHRDLFKKAVFAETSPPSPEHGCSPFTDMAIHE